MNKFERLMAKFHRQNDELNQTFLKMEQEYRLIIDARGTEETLKRVAFQPKEIDKQRFVKHVIGNDIHAPDHNPQAIDLFEQFITDVRPDVLHINGDLCNFTTVSKYLVVDYRKTLNEELDVARGVFYHIVDTARKANPNVEVYFEYGNHEARLAKFLWRNADALTDLEDVNGDPVLTIEHLFNLKENKINYIPYGQAYRQENFIVTHGEKLGVKSGYASHKNIEVYSSDGATGHTHKEGLVTRNMGDRVIVWGEYGCLCNLHPTPAYVTNPDWTNGFGYIVYDKQSKLTHPTPIIIRNNQFYFGGKLYEANVR
jgi:hypothetical protein